MSRRRLTAATADKHDLYERSVQDTEVDIALMTRIYEKVRGEKPLSLREDFCGTAKLCADWVASDVRRTAWGLDLHAPTLAYGREKHVTPLGPAAGRVRLLRRDVTRGIATKVDIVAAYNFSYCVFHERAAMLRYFRGIARGLAPGGCFFFDIHGGPEAQVEAVERSRRGGFTYVWEQRPLDPITARAVRYIHFEFPDGTKLSRAFRYDWRIWTLPELIDLAREAGFARVDVYWEGATEAGEGNGVFRKVRVAPNEESWVSYCAAWLR